VKPRSRSGLIARIVAPRFFASYSAAIMRGWLLAGFWPMTMNKSACSKSSSVQVPLPVPMLCFSA
jgi:hypothetical protein